MPLLAPPREVQRSIGPALPAFVRRVNAASWPSGVYATSWWRSPDWNRNVGGNAFSQHLGALALDIGGTRDQLRGAVDAARSVGLVAVDEGDHVHVQLLPAGVFGNWVQSLPVSLSAVFGHPDRLVG